MSPLGCQSVALGWLGERSWLPLHIDSASRQRRWKVETSTGIAWRAGSHFAPKLPRDLPLFHLGDFNRDGKPDLVVVGENDAQVSVLLNNTP